MSDNEDYEESKQEDSKQSQKNGNKEDQFKARKRPEEPRPPQKLFSPPNPQQREQKRLEYLNSKMDDEKQQLCRFWLRGLCMFRIQQCKFAHGIDDLIYVQSEEEVDLDAKHKDYNQKALWIEAKPSYLNVYDYQFEIQDKLERIYTQEEIDTDRLIRKNIREFYHKKALYDFYRLLRREHPNRDFTEQFIEREYNRIGFNKIGFKLKYQYILNSLSDTCFESKVLPQGQKKPVVVLLEFPENQKQIFFNQIVDLCKQYVQSEGFPIMESSIRKQHYSIAKQTEPGLHQILQYIKKENLKEYFDELEKNQDFIDKVTEGLSQEEKQQAIEKIFSYDNEIEHLKERALEIIHHNKKNIFSLDRLEQTIIKEFPQNVKALGSQSKFRNVFRSFLIKQKINIVRTQTHDYCIKYDVNPKKGASNIYSCKCPLEEITFKTEQLNENVINKFSSMRIVVVDDEESLNYANYTIPKYKHVGVDLEGALRKEGYVQLVQISIQLKPDFTQIFIFDTYQVQNIKEDKVLEKNMINCIQNIMQDVNIIKIFHDCRRDSLALHLFMKACPKNVFDTAAIHAFKLHVEKYIGLNTKEDKNILQLLKSLEELKQPGLNDILSIYNTSHGINLLKDSMHQKFQEMPSFYFLKRPIDPEFLEYSARDVEDLIEAYHFMIESIKQTCKQAFPKANEQIIMQWVSKISKQFSVDWKSNQ